MANNAVSATEYPDHAGLQIPPKKLRVVIVEDEAIISMELEMILEAMGAEVVGTAMSAAEANTVIAAKRPDFVTMDINIKGDRDGVFAAVDAFKKYGIRSIFVSAYGDAATKARAEAASPWGWVRKPIDSADLEDIVRQIKRQSD